MKISEYDLVPLHELVSNYKSGIACGDKLRDQGIIHLRMNNVTKQNTLTLQEVWRIPESTKGIQKHLLSVGDILFNNTNSPDLVGKCCIVDALPDEPVVFSNHLTRIRLKDGLYAKYLLYWLNWKWETKYFHDNCIVWINQASFSVSDKLLPLRIPIPKTYEDQVIIADRLDAQFDNVGQIRQATLKQIEAVNVLPLSLLNKTFNIEKENS